MKVQKLKIKLLRQIKNTDFIYLTWQINGRAVNVEAFLDEATKAPFILHMES